MKKCISILVPLVAFVVFLSCAPKAEPTKTVAPAGQPSVAIVAFLQGEVVIDEKPAEIGQSVAVRARIRTGPDASCELVYNGKNAIRLGKNTEAVIDFAAATAEIELNRGGVTSVLRKLGKVAGTDSFRIRTGTAVAGVRGTSFCVWADATSTYVCACNGTVHTEDAKGGNELTLTAAHHLAKLYTAAGQSISVEAAGMAHHDDHAVESLAERIGESVDWTVVDRGGN